MDSRLIEKQRKRARIEQKIYMSTPHWIFILRFRNRVCKRHKKVNINTFCMLSKYKTMLAVLKKTNINNNLTFPLDTPT